MNRHKIEDIAAINAGETTQDIEPSLGEHFTSAELNRRLDQRTPDADAQPFADKYLRRRGGPQQHGK